VGQHAGMAGIEKLPRNLQVGQHAGINPGLYKTIGETILFLPWVNMQE